MASGCSQEAPFGLFELDRAGNKATARARAYCRGCPRRDIREKPGAPSELNEMRSHERPSARLFAVVRGGWESPPPCGFALPRGRHDARASARLAT